METLWAAPSMYCHTEQISGILAKQHLMALTERRREGWEKHSTKWQASNKLLRQHFANNCKQATAPARGIGPPPA